MSLIEMSLSGAVMILAIVVLRALLLHKLPKRAFLALWGVAAARLLVPFSFRSALSVYSLLGRLSAAGAAANARPAVSFARIAPAQGALPAPDAAVRAPAAIPWGIVWGIGALACAGFFAAVYLKCRREFRASLPVEDERVNRWLRAQRVRRRVEIRQSDRISAPLTYGVLRPVILMPKATDWADWDALQYVLTHELVHIRRFDAATKLLLTAALCVHWFNPAVWVMSVLANRDIELSCDEAVIRRFGARAKSAYALALIRMEEARGGPAPLGSHFSKNAIEERIVAIMKIKKASLAALLAAAALVAGVTTAFATSAEDARAPRGDTGDAPVTATEAAEWLSIVNPEDGKTYYSFDGGKTFEALTDEELEARFPSADVEWWTADEYAAWLENEKAELQALIGERAWTSSRGEFVWTQEIVDETIAMYEDILESIRNGALYSKTIGGADASVTLSSGTAGSEAGTLEGEAAASDFAEYAPFGLVWDESEKALYWNGQRVRYFLDGVDVDGGVAVRLECLDTESAGDIDVRTVRERVQNPDGSFDPFGPLTGLKKCSPAEYDANTRRIAATRDAQSAMTQESAEDWGEAALSDYVPFGLSYRIEADAADGGLRMYWQGKPVHSVFDAQKGVWIANSARGLYLGPDAVDLEAVYERGELTGLRETEAQAEAGTAAFKAASEGTAASENAGGAISSVAEGNATESGTTFAEVFQKYAPFGIAYEEAEGSVGNVYYNGQRVGSFVDLTPDGGAFTFSSAEQGEIVVRTVYGEDGALAGLKVVGE